MKYEHGLVKAFIWFHVGILLIGEVTLWLLLNAVRAVINKPYMPFSVVSGVVIKDAYNILGETSKTSYDDVCDYALREEEEFFNKEYDD